MAYVFILINVLLTVYGLLAVKWQVSNAGSMPTTTYEQIHFLIGLVLSPWVISAYFAAFLASISWMIAIRKMELSYAYPFTSLSYVLVIISGAILFRESITIPKIMGLV